MEKIYIYGPPGVGKSTLGAELANTLRIAFIDLDDVIEERVGLSIQEIFTFHGESEFRRIEKELLYELSSSDYGVVALGGGALLDLENRQIAEETGIVILLDADVETLLGRVKNESGKRPLLSGGYVQNLHNLLTTRMEHYHSFNQRIKVDGRSISDLVWDMQVLLGKFHLNGMSKEYDVIIANHGLSVLGETLLNRGFLEKVILVSDKNVAQYYEKIVEESLTKDNYDVSSVIIEPGEKNKTIETVISLWQKFISFGIDRQSLIIALGGGVVGDLTGFAAATILRGVRWVNIPTTLLAICDASIGGKTGADLSFGKNLIGAFYPPELVFVDPKTLQTLPDEEIRNGLAEIVKHGIIDDGELFELTSKGIPYAKRNWDIIIKKAMAVKIKIIEQDPYEKGIRSVLNLGHTLGHALEKASDYQIKHGEGVSIGIVFASLLSEELKIAERGLTDRIIDSLNLIGLPVLIPKEYGPQQLIKLMQVDKKRKHNKSQFVLPKSIGEVIWGIEVEDDILIRIMENQTER